jgi:hypothetical protein
MVTLVVMSNKYNGCIADLFLIRGRSNVPALVLFLILPMSTVTIIEDALMIAMSIGMLLVLS